MITCKHGCRGSLHTKRNPFTASAPQGSQTPPPLSRSDSPENLLNDAVLAALRKHFVLVSVEPFVILVLGAAEQLADRLIGLNAPQFLQELLNPLDLHPQRHWMPRCVTRQNPLAPVKRMGGVVEWWLTKQIH
ncbi:MAG: hypothetical protein ACRD3T_01595 [Terriglobia bacterium]